uniref:BHLH domain-containing protein n=1 Tax=Aegilops tauschii subsp. strangulata TaxID=200361 RepID=A0A453PRQ8_AEGTS
MALEAVVFSKGFFGRCAMAAEGVGGGGGVWGGNGHGHGGGMELDGSNAHCGAAVASTEAPEGSSSLPALPPPGHGSDPGGADDGAVDAASASGAAGRRKRRRARSVKNIEEAESQRMTHIAVERNRRKQMNEYLGVLRSLMPASYVHRGDQASIIGGAINYVKELEQLVQSLEAHRHARLRDDCPVSGDVDSAAAVPFLDFFTFPQYTMSVRHAPATPAAGALADDGGGNAADDDTTSGSKQSAVADIEVTIVESHASLKVLSRRRPTQLLRIVAGLQGHRLAVLHLNATSAGHMALYCLSLKVRTHSTDSPCYLAVAVSFSRPFARLAARA